MSRHVSNSIWGIHFIVFGQTRTILSLRLSAIVAVTLFICLASRGSFGDELGRIQQLLTDAASIEDDRQRQGQFSNLRSRLDHQQATFGGAAQADFDALIELITTTIEPDSWEELGGVGTIQEFPGGVSVDLRGFMQPDRRDSSNSLSLVGLQRENKRRDWGNHDVRRHSQLRKVSLPRLEKAVQMRWAMGLGPTGTMNHLAGLERIDYIFVFPETGDLVIAGPAGDWLRDPEGRAVNLQSRSPVLQLDDLVVTMRNAFENDGQFGCSITPRKENLRATQDFIDKSSKRTLRPSDRNRWLAQLRSHLGQQDITLYGVSSDSHTARVLVEADYHMKLIGMGLAHGVLGVESYLDSIEVSPNQTPPPLGVLRWWFTLGNAHIESSPSRDVYALHGNIVSVLSENELLTKSGRRVHTGESERLNLQFANSFTRHFNALARRYPVYAELRNVFQFAVIAAMIRSEGLLDRVGWQALHFLDDQLYRIRTGNAPTAVSSVINHRVVHDKYVIAGVSGGVSVKAGELVRQSEIRITQASDFETGRAESHFPKEAVEFRWWWD